MAYEPPRPAGSGSDSRWFQWVHDAIKSLKPQQVPNSLVNHTTKGVSIISKAVSGGPSAPAAPSVKVSMFKLKELFGDYLRCKTWDGTRGGDGAGEGEDDVLIAKPFKLWNTILTANLDLVTVGYTYDPTTVKRTATTDIDHEIQIVIPRYLIDDIIYAAECKGGNSGVNGPGDVPIKWIDLNRDGRAWARKFQQF